MNMSVVWSAQAGIDVPWVLVEGYERRPTWIGGSAWIRINIMFYNVLQQDRTK